MTIPELAEALSITSRAVEKQISKLRVDGRLLRIGPAKGGHWEVVAPKGTKEADANSNADLKDR